MSDVTNEPPAIDIGKQVEQYVTLRDKIKNIEEQHKEELKPHKEQLEQMNVLLLERLLAIGADHIATPYGTVHRTTKKSATIADKSLFRDWVISHEDWDLVDLRANVTAVEDFISSRKEPPPGVNWTTYAVVGVRRK